MQTDDIREACMKLFGTADASDKLAAIAQGWLCFCFV